MMAGNPREVRRLQTLKRPALGFAPKAGSPTRSVGFVERLYLRGIERGLRVAEKEVVHHSKPQALVGVHSRLPSRAPQKGQKWVAPRKFIVLSNGRRVVVPQRRLK